MARRLTSDEVKRVRDWMDRAQRRLDGAAAVASRKRVTEGEFDNNFDGTVTAIFHIVDAVELVRTGTHRRVGEGEESTMIRSVILTLANAGIPEVPAATRLTDLNSRRNASVHGEWAEVLDHEALGDAVAAARAFHKAARAYIQQEGVNLHNA